MKKALIVFAVLINNLLYSQYIPLDKTEEGLYQNSNDMPDFYFDLYQDACISLDTTNVVYLSLGASSPKKEFTMLQSMYPTFSDKNNKLKLVNGCVGGKSWEDISIGWDSYINTALTNLSAQGLTANDVSVIWFKSDALSNNINTLTQEEYLAYAQSYAIDCINKIAQEFPNCKIIYLSGRHWGKDGSVHAEPRAYYNQLVTKQLVQKRIEGAVSISPLIVWAHPFYTGSPDELGISANSFNHTWQLSDMSDDVHPTQDAQIRIVNYIHDWFIDEPGKYWFTNQNYSEPQDTVIEFKGAHENVSFHWQNGFDPVYTAQDYKDIVELGGKELPFRFRVFDDKLDSVTREIDIDGIYDLLILNDTLNANGITLSGVFCVDYQLDVNTLIEYIDMFKTFGVKIIAIEGDNEAYSKLTWEQYIAYIKPMRDALLVAYPDLPFLYPSAGRPSDSDNNGILKSPGDILGGRSAHKVWNDKLAIHISTAPPIDGIVTHLYPNQYEMAESSQVPMEVVFYYTVFNQEMENYYNDVISETQNAVVHYQKTFDYLSWRFPNRDIYVTEFGTPTESMRNSIAFSNYIWTVLNQFHGKAKYWFFHNGFSPTTAGSKYSSRRTDTETGNLRRTEWYTIQMFRNMPENAVPYTYGNSPDFYLPSNVSYLGGFYNYSGSGNSMWMTKESKAGYVIDGIHTADFFPQNSFGYSVVISPEDTIHEPTCDTIVTQTTKDSLIIKGTVKTDSIIHITFDTTYTVTIDLDTVWYINCEELYYSGKCNNFWYKITGKCKTCKLLDWFYIVESKDSTITITPNIEVEYFSYTVLDSTRVEYTVFDTAYYNCEDTVIGIEVPMIYPKAFVPVPSANCDGVNDFYNGEWYINGCKSKKIYEQAYLAYQSFYPDSIMNMEVRDEDSTLIIFYPDILNNRYNVNADILSIFPANTIVYIRPKNTAGQYVVPVGEDPRTQVKSLPVEEMPVQPLDADTLIFEDEIQFEKFLDYHGLADYEILPSKFDATIPFDDNSGVPFSYVDWTYNDIKYTNLYAPTASYYSTEVQPNEAYLYENLFWGKRFCMFFDHSATHKNYKMFLIMGECGDHRYADMVMTYFATGQVAVFKNCWTWSDRNGENIFNINLKTWLLWGNGQPEVTLVDAFQHRLPTTDGSNCDFDFHEQLTGHETTTLYWQRMTEFYGHLRK